MKAGIVEKYGDPNEVLKFVQDFPKPEFESGKKKVLIKVLTYSMTPGDYRLIAGETSLIKNPGKFPFIPGRDVVGVVEQVDEGSKFKVGEKIVASWNEFGVGGLAEYCLVDEDVAAKKPDFLTDIQAVAFCNSAVYAFEGFKLANIKSGDRVLILGGSGGVGSILIQLVKNIGRASFVATTSTATEMMIGLGADLVINHEEKEWSKDFPEFKTDKFDVIIDCAEGRKAWFKCGDVLKLGNAGGRFVAFIPNDWVIIMKNPLQPISWFSKVLWRVTKSKMFPFSMPRYTFVLAGVSTEKMENIFSLAQEGMLRVVIDDDSPHPFTQEGIVAAFDKLKRRKGHGKIVIEIATDDQLST